MDAVSIVREKLFELADEKYKAFHCKLIPTVDEENVIGVRTPALRAYAKSLKNTELAEEFLQALPHGYYDENNLHGFLLEQIKDYDKLIPMLEAFLPYVDNWATCDLMSPKVFKKHTDELLAHIKRWLASDKIYTVRFGLEMLMSYYLDERFSPEYLALCADVKSEEYYVNMMRAWFFATALAKQYEAAVVYIENNSLDIWTHNKSIRKAIESNRITQEQKDYLRTLKR